MRTISITGLFLLLTIMACEKNNDDPDKDQNQLTATDYFPLSIGSYWVYNSYTIDSMGNEDLVSENDTIRIIGDTVMNGKQYAVFYKKQHLFLSNPSKEKFYYRDSASYIINEKGVKLLTINNSNDTLVSRYPLSEHGDSSVYVFSSMEQYLSTVSLPAGEFDSIMNCKLTVIYNQSANPLTGNLARYYAPKVGGILYQSIYISLYRREKEYIETRLVDYHIAP